MMTETLEPMAAEVDPQQLAEQLLAQATEHRFGGAEWPAEDSRPGVVVSALGARAPLETSADTFQTCRAVRGRPRPSKPEGSDGRSAW